MTVRELLEMPKRFEIKCTIITPNTVEEYPDASRAIELYGDCDVRSWVIKSYEEDSVKVRMEI